MILHASGAQWQAFVHGADSAAQPDPAGVPVPAFPSLTAPACVVWEPSRRVSGVIALEGNPRHAPVLIERQLRAEGSIDGETKVLVHRVRSVGQGYQALYCAVPQDEWQQMLGWVGRQSQHCLLFSPVGLLAAPPSAAADAPAGSLQAAVWHSGTQFTFVGWIEGQLLQVHTVALGDRPQDLAAAAANLGERVQAEVRRLASRTSRRKAWVVDWYSAAARPQDSGPANGQAAASLFAAGLHADPGAAAPPRDRDDAPHPHHAFARASGCRLRHEAEEADPGAAVPGVVALARRGRVTQSLDHAARRWMFTADAALAVCAIVATAFALGVLALAFGWQAQARQSSAQAVALGKREAAVREQVHAMQAGRSGQGGQGASAAQAALTATAAAAATAAQLAFLATLERLEAGHDVAGLLRAVKAAAGGDLRVLGLRSEDPASTAAARLAGSAATLPPIPVTGLAVGGGVPASPGPAAGQPAATDPLAGAAVLVDCMLPEGALASSGELLSGFVRGLRHRGYQAAPVDTGGGAAVHGASRLVSYRVTRLTGDAAAEETRADAASARPAVAAAVPAPAAQAGGAAIAATAPASDPGTAGAAGATNGNPVNAATSKATATTTPTGAAVAAGGSPP